MIRSVKQSTSYITSKGSSPVISLNNIFRWINTTSPTYYPEPKELPTSDPSDGKHSPIPSSSNSSSASNSTSTAAASSTPLSTSETPPSNPLKPIQPHLLTYAERRWAGPKWHANHNNSNMTSSTASVANEDPHCTSNTNISTSPLSKDSIVVDPKASKKRSTLTYTSLMEMFPLISNSWLPQRFKKLKNKEPEISNSFKYEFNHHSVLELSYMIKSVILSKNLHYPDVMMTCIQPGSYYYLEKLVQQVASNLNADVISLDPHSLIEFIDLLKSKGFMGTHFDLQDSVVGFNKSQDAVTIMHSLEQEGDEDDGDISVVESHTRDMFSSLRYLSQYVITQESKKIAKRQEESKKTTKRLEEALDVMIKAASEKQGNEGRPILFHLNDVADLLTSKDGTAVLVSLAKRIAHARSKGYSVTLVASLSPSIRSSKISADDFVNIERALAKLNLFSTVGVFPMKNDALEIQFQKDKWRRIHHINILNLKHCFAQKGYEVQLENWESSKAVGWLDQTVFDDSQLKRIVGVCIGYSEPSSTPSSKVISHDTLEQALSVIEQKDIQMSSILQDISSSSVSNLILRPSKLPQTKAKLHQLREKLGESLTAYEKKLWTCLIEPESIPTGFNDICLPEKTLQSFKTVIQLPLVNPEQFQYGVLSKHSIQGVLLFGPPGTGKTMVAKAVAKESGSHFLNISLSDIYDKYFGEGEKNVRAVFTLARKLSPCVVFLDEVDALFGVRRSDSNSGKREVMNEFMSEWDGLKTCNNGIIVMGATNRPFDLDDAVLRRMPQRILIDLPSSEERLHILRLHLSGENVSSDVDLLNLAKLTEYYSGSDLKNLCVMAAIYAVQDLRQQSTTPDLTGRQRVLLPSHFDKAMKEVRATLNSEMEALRELRKWNDHYGQNSFGSERTSKRAFGF